MIQVDVEEEKKEIIRRYRRLLRKAKPFLKDDDAKVIKKAFNVSLDAHREMRRKSWLQMEELIGEGKTRMIGVSNYTEKHLKELLEFCEIKPAVLQVATIDMI